MIRPGRIDPQALAKPPRETRHERMARKDAQAAIARDIPDPDDFARYMPLPMAVALLSAWKNQSYGWCVTPRIAAYLRPLGLVAYNDYGLTAFGYAVLLALRRQDA